MSSFYFSEELLDKLDRVQGGGGGGGGKSNRVNTGGGASPAPKSRRSIAGRTAAAREQLGRTAKRAPQVVVKITSRLHGAGNLLGGMTYIGRVGWKDEEQVEVKDQNGNKLETAEQMRELAQLWEAAEQHDIARRQGATAIAMVFSMPPGTPADQVESAVREFAEDEFSNRRWVMALHTDEPHPHVHILIAARDDDGRRFAPDRAFLQRCREGFAERLQARGIEADATKRMTRGYTPKHDPMPVIKMRERAEKDPSIKIRVDEGRRALLNGEKVEGAPSLADQDRQHSKTMLNFQWVKDVYRAAADELMTRGGADEKRQAQELLAYVDSMPEPLNRRAEIIERMKEGKALPANAERDPELEKLVARRENRDAEWNARLEEINAKGDAMRALARGESATGKADTEPPDRGDLDDRLERMKARAEEMRQLARAAQQPQPDRPDVAKKLIERVRDMSKELQRDRAPERTKARDQDRGGPTR